MKEYTITYVENKPDWEKIPKLDINEVFGKKYDEITAEAQIAYTKEAFLVHLSTVEENFRKVETGTVGMPCEDSCLEFFFSPINDDKRYFNIEFNANGAMFLGMGSSVDDLTRLVFAEEELFKPQIIENEKGWEIFYTVPFEFVLRFFKEFKAEKGKYVYANCYKCSDLTEPPHYFSWSPILGDPFTFHRTEGFGTMTFTE